MRCKNLAQMHSRAGLSGGNFCMNQARVSVNLYAVLVCQNIVASYIKSF